MDALSQPPPPPEPSKAPSVSGLGRRIRGLRGDITSILYGPNLAPSLLASDVAGFFLHVLLATDWSKVCQQKLFDFVPLLRTTSENLYSFRDAFQQERWHQEDHARERMDRWCPHLYRPLPRGCGPTARSSTGNRR
ncbi:dimethylaniline monooxygenase [Colletotrichum tofieldiae]|nr:dimethylaniline monooxygenase [Colletotrichum tofieldiae]